MYESLLNFPGSLFTEFERLQRQLDDAFGSEGRPASIRSVAPGSFPAVNIGSTPTSVEVFAFAPGIDPSQVEVTIDRGVLSLAGERVVEAPAGSEQKRHAHSRERLSGRFRRSISLPEDIDPSRVNATYRDGVLHISVARREEAQPRRISVQ